MLKLPHASINDNNIYTELSSSLKFAEMYTKHCVYYISCKPSCAIVGMNWVKKSIFNNGVMLCSEKYKIHNL